jgi:integrase
MPAAQPDLFDPPAGSSPRAYNDAFAAWLASREDFGQIREASSAAVYGSMWSALSAWCVGNGLHIDVLSSEHLQAYLLSRGGNEDLSARYAWRLLSLADAVLAHRTRAAGLPRNNAAHDLLHATPAWRYANAHDKTPLPEHLQAHEARALVAWLLAPQTAVAEAGAPEHSWQAVRNRTAVALQLGAGLTPGDIRAAELDGVVSSGGKVAGLPWKIRLPAHGSMPAREAPIAPWAGRQLRSWLEARSALQATGPALFPATRSGRPWGKVAQYNAAKAVLEAAGLPATEGGSFKLRHTFALRQLRRGTPPEQVAQWMGLTDSAALARYRQVLLAPVEVV